MRAPLFRTVFLFLIFLIARTPAHATEGVQVDAMHGQLKARLQASYYSRQEMESVVAGLKALIARYEASTSKASIQVGLLLLDIGEASIKRSLPPFDVSQADHLRRGIEAIQVGDRIVAPLQSQNPNTFMNRARAHFYLGRAWLLLGQKANAERALRTGLAIHWRVYNDNEWQLKFFEHLFEAVETAKAKREVAEGELKIARGLTRNPWVEIRNAEMRLQQATLTDNTLITQFDAARAKAEAEAKDGKADEAYRTLASTFAKLSGGEDKALFTARMKPDGFLIYDDPLTRDKQTDKDANRNFGVSPYDLVAAHFFVDRGLMPFIQESRGNLMSLLGLLETAFETADHKSTEYFCRLIPPHYGSYADRLPDFCNATPQWAAWMQVQVDAGSATRLLELGIALLPTPADRTPLQRQFLRESQEGLAQLEAEHGSPDSFFSAYERIDRPAGEKKGSIDFYAGIISDLPHDVIAALPETEKAYLESDFGGKVDPLGKLGLIGTATAHALCTAEVPTLNGITKAQMCIAAGLEDKIGAEAVSRTANRIRSAPEWDPRGPRIQFDWTAYELFSQPRFASVRNELAAHIAPGQLEPKFRFVKASLTATEVRFLRSPMSYDAYLEARAKDSALPDPQVSETFRMSRIADALAQGGELDLARSWAEPALRENQSADEPQTIHTLYLGEGYDVAIYHDGWRWLILDAPILAEAAFNKAIPKTTLYSRASTFNETTSASLPWDRIIGAYHGRMMARKSLGDQAGAISDAQALTSYVNYVLGLQSFTRNETKLIIARVARPALAEALRTLLEVDGNEAAKGDAIFGITQLLDQTRTGVTVARVGARLSAKSPDLAELARKREASREKWARAAAENSELRSELAAEIDALDAEIRQKFPSYVDLAGTLAISLDEARTLLEEDEALISFVVLKDKTVAVVLGRDGSRYHVVDLGREELGVQVQTLRCGLDEEEWATPTSAGRCANLLGLTEKPDETRPLPFDLGRAHALYKALFGQIEEMIAGKRLVIVPSGPLTSLPFHVLVTKAPEATLPRTFDGYRNVTWLGRSHALTALPAVSSLKALRQNVGNRPAAAADYAGYGNPVLQGDAASCRLPKVPEQCPTIEVAQLEPVSSITAEQTGEPQRATVRGRGGRRSAKVTTDDVFSNGATMEAVVEQVRGLCPLPDTAYEIKCVGERFKEQARLIRLDREAREPDIKALSQSGKLAGYRILHFATHGLLSGDVEQMAKRQGEPALVMTPPDKPADADDDGLLMASEVAGLKLNADWVVLSACNTAAGDTIGAEALSGLARAFFSAGARALLVSHWPVYSDAAVRLTTRAFAELDRNPRAGRAEALRQAMIALTDDRSQEDNAHPAVWAPFAVIGEGGR